MEKMTALEVYCLVKYTLIGAKNSIWGGFELSVKFHSPVTDHDSSDDCGVVILGQRNRLFGKIIKEPNLMR